MLPVVLASRAAQLAIVADLVGIDVDYTSVLKWGVRVARMASRLQADASAVDQRALDEMVALAQARAPRRSGRLIAGITGAREEDAFVFRAEAQRDASSADYAPFVERGTRAGTRGRVFAAPTGYERRAGIRRKARRTHPGTEAQPFFFNSAREVLERRRIDQAAIMARASAVDAEG